MLTRTLVLIIAIATLVDPSLASAQTPTPTPAPAPPASQPPPVAPPTISQEVIVTATIAAVPEDAIARAVTVVTREDLERLGITSVVDALRLVPGLDPRARGPQDVQTDFSIRGSTFGQNLIMVDGMRLNDTQSGHHDGEIPAAVDGIDRIEVVYGAGSAVHGADALGGTINVISRRGAYRTANVEFGQHGYLAAQASASGALLPANWSATAWASRSAGFTFDREFAQGGGSLRGSPIPGLTVDVRHQRRAFGANGFYGNSPSKEWTDQTLGSVNWQRASDGWVTTVKGLVRDHHDHFRWDINRPGFAENLHRTDAAEFTMTMERDLAAGRQATFGVQGGGDWITSSNLGDHHFGRTGVFGELLWPLATQTTLQAGARLDSYSTFGRSLSPSISIATHPTSALRLHVTAGHAFRVPTFTELYYSDPANLGNPDLVAEHGWSFDGGGDWTHGPWTASFSPFRRWDKDVIDWVKPTVPDLWRTTNLRDVTSTGFEASVTRRWGEAILRLHYAGLTIDAPSLTLLSKYVLEYARHQSGGSISVPIDHDSRVALNFDHRHRLDGQSYNLVSARVTHSLRGADVYLDGSNLTNAVYHEVAGVTMPGRWVMVGVTVK